MVQGGLDLTPVITHRFHYTEFEKGFEAMHSGNERQGHSRLDDEKGGLSRMKDRTARSTRAELAAIREAGTYKDERIITTPQTSPHRHHRRATVL